MSRKRPQGSFVLDTQSQPPSKKPKVSHTAQTIVVKKDSPSSSSLRPDASPLASTSDPKKSPMIRKSGGGLSSSGSTPKKLVIKSLKNIPTISDSFEQDCWEKLRAAILAIQQQRPISDSKESLYKIVEDICAHKLAKPVFEKLRDLVQEQVVELFEQIKQIEDLDATLYLKQINAHWTSFCDQTNMIRNIFLYMDRTFVRQTLNQSLYNITLMIFSNRFEAEATILNKVVHYVLTLIQNERDGDLVDRGLLRNIIQMFRTIQFYNKYFETEFLSRSHQFYQDQAAQKISSLEIHDYIDYVEAVSQEETDRTQNYLLLSTKKPILQLIEENLVKNYHETMVTRGFKPLISEFKLSHIQILYNRLKQVGHTDLLRDNFRQYIVVTGGQIVSEVDKDSEMIPRILEFKSKMDEVLAKAFLGNIDFYQSYKMAFEKFINIRADRVAELLAKFLDKSFRSKTTGVNNDEVAVLVQGVISLFRFANSKDVFQAFYQKDLSKRLLLNKSASLEVEKRMISELQRECGQNYTAKLDTMFKDMELSRELMSSSEFIETINSNQAVDLYVDVLNITVWPAYQPITIALPPSLSALLNGFERFYLKKYDNRKLIWQHSMSYCVVKATFPSGTFELSVSFLQAIVLLQFNDKPILSYQQIKEATQIEEKDLKRTLQSLACGKVRVIAKNPLTREVNDDDKFAFNKKFASKLYRLKINQIQIEETKEEKDQTDANVAVQRQHQIDAAVVRIMKTRKTRTHQALLSELFDHLKFPFTKDDVEKRIETLIEREYVERDSVDSNIFRYVA